MALDTLADLKTSVSTWLARSDMGGMAEDFIALAEARLNRELNPIETTSTVSCVASSREIDVASLAVEEPISLFLSDAFGNEAEPVQKAPGTFAFIGDTGAPSFWCYDNGKIVFDRPADQAYSARFRFTQRFKLSDDAPTNWLLTYHPDIYLAATLIWGNILKRSTQDALPFLTVLEKGLPEVKHTLAQSKRAVLTVDPALSSIGRNRAGYWS